MTSFKGIPIESGAKYTTAAGFTAIRNGIKPRSGSAIADTGRPTSMPTPPHSFAPASRTSS